MERADHTYRTIATTLVVVATLIALLAAQRISYLLFHALVELFSVTIAGAVFLLALNARNFLGRNRFLLILAVALAAVGFIDLLHTLAYQGMGVFPGARSANLATQLWLAARLLFAASLVATVLSMGRRPRLWPLLGGYALATILLLASIFAWDVFPTCFVEGEGLTPFKIVSEYAVVAATLGTGAFLWVRRGAVDPRLWRPLLAAVALLALSEVSFTLYLTPFSFANMVGHLLKVAAFYLLYRAIVRVGVAEPFALLFRDLEQNRAALAAANEHLEERVRERTAALAERQEALQQMARQLGQVERRERRRLAALLHDELAQLLAVLRLRLTRLDPDRPADIEPIRDKALSHTDEAIRFTRTLITRLAPPRYENGGLPDALSELAAQFRAHDLEATVAAAPDLPPVDPDAGEVILQAVRELLMNVVKYAGVPQAAVDLRAEDHHVLVTVRDAGRGFDPARLPRVPTTEGGFGLGNVRAQVELLGGDVAIRSAPGAGTAVTLSVPVARAGNGQAG